MELGRGALANFDPAKILPPKWDLTLEDFYVWENSLVEWASPSNQCNTVHDGKADHWNVALKGSDLKSSFDASNPCPV